MTETVIRDVVLAESDELVAVFTELEVSYDVLACAARAVCVAAGAGNTTCRGSRNNADCEGVEIERFSEEQHRPEGRERVVLKKIRAIPKFELINATFFAGLMTQRRKRRSCCWGRVVEVLAFLSSK